MDPSNRLRGMRARTACAALVVALAALACRPPDPGRERPDDRPRPDSTAAAASPGDEAPRLTVDRRLYTVRPDDETERASIAYRYRNRGADTLYHPTCRPGGGPPTVNVGIERLVDGAWEPAWSQALPQCLSEPIVIPPGSTFRDTLEIVLHPQDTLHQPLLTPRTEIDGTYRLVWYQLLRTYDPDRYPFGEEIPLHERLSGTFELRR